MYNYKEKLHPVTSTVNESALLSNVSVYYKRGYDGNMHSLK